MLKVIRLYILFLLFLCFDLLNAQQESSLYPIRFIQYYNGMSIYNPAHGCIENDYEVATGNQRLIGNFNGISTYFLVANMKISGSANRMNSPFSVLGLYVYNDREGKYLNRSRFYATYAWHGNITKKLKVSGGFHMGGFNYSVKGTPLSGDGSDFSPDGIIGVYLYNSIFKTGISYNQIFNNSIQPLEEYAKLNPFVNFSGDVSLNRYHDVIFRPVWALRIPLNNDRLLADFTLLTVYKEKLRLGFGVHNSDKMIINVDFLNILNQEQELGISICYSFPVTDKGISTRFIELGINYRFNKNY